MKHPCDALLPIPRAKRILDIIITGLALIILSPLFLAIAIAIKVEGFFFRTSRGPIFYSETRISQGEPFTLRKFRIFKVSAYAPARFRGETVHTKPLERDPNNLTVIGKTLKKFYLDELPQLWNVFIGDMSLVGTRPWNPVDYQKEIARGFYRKKIIKAGLTGPVQLYKLDAPAWGGEQKLDNDYIDFCRRHRGAWLILKDIGILCKSLWFMIKGQGL